jgi:hypothetical protein
MLRERASGGDLKSADVALRERASGGDLKSADVASRRCDES